MVLSIKQQIEDLVAELEFVLVLMVDAEDAEDIGEAMEGLEGQAGRISAIVAEAESQGYASLVNQE
jgi:enoyl-[acyl-carrier-protein] reductase (NADH)